MKRKLTILGLLLLGTLFLASTGLLEPRKAFAFCDASISGDDCLLNDDGGTGSGTGGGNGPVPGACTVSNCITTCTGPTGAECCCWYQCRSGGQWVCKSGYCPETSRSCGL